MRFKKSIAAMAVAGVLLVPASAVVVHGAPAAGQEEGCPEFQQALELARAALQRDQTALQQLQAASQRIIGVPGAPLGTIQRLENRIQQDRAFIQQLLSAKAVCPFGI